MERRYKIQCTPFYYKNWCTGPFFLAWIIHESEDGTKHVFTLLVVEMVRGIYLYIWVMQWYDLIFVCMRWPLTLLTCRADLSFSTVAAFLRRLGTRRTRPLVTPGVSKDHSCYEPKKGSWAMDGNAIPAKSRGQQRSAMLSRLALQECRPQHIPKKPKPAEHFRNLHSSTVSTWHHTAAQGSPTRCTTGPLLWVTTPVVTWKAVWHFDSSQFWDCCGSHQSWSLQIGTSVRCQTHF